MPWHPPQPFFPHTVLPRVAALLDPGSPLLARLTGADGRRQDIAFAWLDGRVVWVQPEDIRVDDESSEEREPPE